MRLRDYFPDGAVVIKKSAKDWQQAIEFSMEALLKNHYINEHYVQAIKDSTLSNGPYYILAPGVAMPHARPECGALKTGLSLVLLQKPVSFDEGNDPVKLLIGLAAAQANSHIEAIQALSELLCEEEHLAAMLNADSIEQLKDIIALA
ncbi:PTS mannitol transporter subunit IIA [Superficieibacter sp.]|uniref:PTS mannitol transporter subunit IIA n=1 Tax=Superficieibacter sp. TaxID=2303322 RepID=UPI0028A67DEB|nr:PTS mannitol transporter subunit IIA [Superficieibacter sp.]